MIKLWTGKLSQKMNKQMQFHQILMKKHITCRIQNFHILLAFLLNAIELLIAFTVIKHQTTQKHILPFHVPNNDLREVLY